MKDTSSAKMPTLKLRNIVKRFGGVTAADEVCFELHGGEVFGLIGPNGSGKTTLLNLITGIYKADGGVIELEGHGITRFATHTRARLGIIRSFQHPRLLERCDVETNIRVGLDLSNRYRKSENERGEKYMYELLEVAGLSGVDLKGGIDRLSYGQEKLLEIVRAMLADPKVLLLDEPAAGLNRAEMHYISALIDMAKKEGVAILLIEHAIDFVMDVCDRITVLNFGRQITTGAPSHVQEHPGVIEAYLGGAGVNA